MRRTLGLRSGDADAPRRSRRGRSARILLHRGLRGIDEVGAQPRNVVAFHLAGLQPQAVADAELLVLLERLLEVGAEAAVVPLAEARLLGVVGAVEVRDGVTLVADHEAHR